MTDEKLFCSHCKKEISGKCEECDSLFEKGDYVMCLDGEHEHYHEEDQPDQYEIVTEEKL